MKYHGELVGLRDRTKKIKLEGDFASIVSARRRLCTKYSKELASGYGINVFDQSGKWVGQINMRNNHGAHQLYWYSVKQKQDVPLKKDGNLGKVREHNSGAGPYYAKLEGQWLWTTNTNMGQASTVTELRRKLINSKISSEYLQNATPIVCYDVSNKYVGKLFYENVKINGRKVWKLVWLGDTGSRAVNKNGTLGAKVQYW